MKTKIPKVSKLPSGSFRCQIVGPDGKRISITAPTAQEVQAKAVAIRAGILQAANPSKKGAKLSLLDAIDSYIDNKSSVLSPSTIRGYGIVKRHRFPALLKMDVSQIGKADVQKAVNAESKLVSPKTVANAYGLIRPVLKECGVDVFGIKLPQKLKKKPAFVQPEELRAFYAALADDECRLPIMIALWLGMRRSEILGLCWDCVDFRSGTVTVRRVLVPDEHNQWVLRDGARNESSQRRIAAPSYIMQELKTLYESRITAKPEDRIFRFHPDTIRRHVHKACERAGITDTSLHGLRHTNAAVMRHIGIPDAFAMERGGWTNEKTYKETYSYVFETAETSNSRRIDDFFQEKILTEILTEK